MLENTEGAIKNEQSRSTCTTSFINLGWVTVLSKELFSIPPNKIYTYLCGVIRDLIY